MVRVTERTIDRRGQRLSLPDIGVDYQQMRVVDPRILQGFGLTDVRKGDRVALDFSRDQELIRDQRLTLRNLRTGQSVAIPLLD